MEFHTAKKRGVYAEESIASNPQASNYRVLPEAVTEDPTPEDAAAVVEEVQTVMQGLDDLQRQIMELALQNFEVEEISQQVQRSGRTVRPRFSRSREDLEQRLLQK